MALPEQAATSARRWPPTGGPTAGIMNYFGKFYRTAMFGLLRRINTYLVRWARRKFKRLRAFKRAKRWWKGLLKRVPRLFAHWAWILDARVLTGQMRRAV